MALPKIGSGQSLTTPADLGMGGFMSGEDAEVMAQFLANKPKEKKPKVPSTGGMPNLGNMLSGLGGMPSTGGQGQCQPQNVGGPSSMAQPDDPRLNRAMGGDRQPRRAPQEEDQQRRRTTPRAGELARDRARQPRQTRAQQRRAQQQQQRRAQARQPNLRQPKPVSRTPQVNNNGAITGGRRDPSNGNEFGVAPGRGLESWKGAPVNQSMVNRIRNPAIASQVESAARAKGIDPNVAKAIVGIESGGNPNARTGSYKGLFQLSNDEFRKYGKGGNIMDPRANIEAGLNSLHAKAGAFEQKYGRPPTPTELYLAHQQGEGGLAKHLANPDRSAVQNMASTAEGRRKGVSWARKAIWGNVPTDMRHLFPGGVDSMTSRQFAAVWASKLQGIPYQQAIGHQASRFGAFGPQVA